MELGPFRLLEPLARGGMGEVWLGRHASGHDVAIKVLTADGARDARLRAHLEAEIRAVATMDHPHVVWIHDQGVVPPGTAVAPGTPWLAMELADGGTLAEHPPRSVAQLRSVLLALLDGLAHAHARGIIHRDIKPANALIGSRGLVLTDFGMARHLERSQDLPAEASGGTPSYMAPEQWTGDDRSQGPWTDLYAVGCLVHTLVSGRPPFRASNHARLAREHLFTPPPPLAGRLSLPEELRAWTDRLLAKDPADRYRWAADAARDLARILPEGPEEDARQPEASPDVPTEIRPVGDCATLVLDLPQTPARAPALRGDDAWPELPDRPDAPTDARTLHLIGVGLGLFGVRQSPLIGRQDERKALWERLRAVHHDRRPRAVVLRGPRGVGKSRLARWLCCRGSEIGAAELLRADHQPVAGATDGLVGMLQRLLRTEGLRGRQLVEHLRETLTASPEPVDARKLAQMLEGAPTTAGDRHLLVRAVLAGSAHRRPLIVWLDDVQWGLDALLFTATVMSEARIPALFVLTAREDALDQRPVEAAELERLGCHPEAVVLSLERLPRDQALELASGLLPMDAQLAGRLAEGCAGDPLFTVQLLTHLVTTRQLEPSPRGWAARAEASLPADLEQLWAARLDALLEGRPEWVQPLEIAATLGRIAPLSEWEAACGSAAIDAPMGLVDALHRHGLVDDDRTAIAFVHRSLRDVLVDRARQAGRLAGHHLACAAALDASELRLAERRGRHLAGAGRVAEAIEPLHGGATWNAVTGNLPVAIEILDVARDAIDQAALPDSNPYRGTNAQLRARALRIGGRRLEARPLLDWLVPAARAHGWDLVLVYALIEQCWFAFDAPARARAAEAVEVAGRLGKPDVLTWARLMQATVLSGDPAHLDEAIAAMDALAHEALQRGDPRLALGCLGPAFSALLRAGRLAQAEGVLARATEIAAAVDLPYWQARIEQHAGELALARDDRILAERYLSRAHRAMLALGSADHQFTGAALGATLSRLGRDGDACALLIPIATHGTEPIAVYAARVALLAADPGPRGDRRARIEEVHSRDPGHPPDLGLVVLWEQVSRRAAEVGDADAAALAAAIARSERARLDP